MSDVKPPAYTPPEWVPDRRWERSWLFLERVWLLFRGDRSLIAVAVVGTLLNVLATVLVFGGVDLVLGHVDMRVMTGISGAVLALPATVIATGCGITLIVMAEARFEGRHCTARQGFAAAWRRRGAIVRWSLLSVGIGAVLDELADRIPGFGAIARLVLGVTWSFASMFALPVLALEEASVRQAARRSAEVFRARWGEGVVGQLSIATIATVVAIPGGLLLLIGLALGGAAGIVFVVPGAALLGVSSAVAEAMDQLYALAVYRHHARDELSFGLTEWQLGLFMETKPRR